VVQSGERARNCSSRCEGREREKEGLQQRKTGARSGSSGGRGRVGTFLAAATLPRTSARLAGRARRLGCRSEQGG
jgi:hypothetical protein